MGEILFKHSPMSNILVLYSISAQFLTWVLTIYITYAAKHIGSKLKPDQLQQATIAAQKLFALWTASGSKKIFWHFVFRLKIRECCILKYFTI